MDEVAVRSAAISRPFPATGTRAATWRDVPGAGACAIARLVTKTIANKEKTARRLHSTITGPSCVGRDYTTISRRGWAISRASANPFIMPFAPMIRRPRIGVFDSGVGGLTVLQALLAVVPQADYFY